MSAPLLESDGRSYDDLPESDVSTVLAIPLRLPSAPPGAGSSSPRASEQGHVPSPSGRRRHRGTRQRRSASAASSAVQAPRHRRRSRQRAVTPASPPPAAAQAPGALRASLQVGLVAALIVFGAAALALALVTWSVQ